MICDAVGHVATSPLGQQCSSQRSGRAPSPPHVGALQQEVPSTAPYRHCWMMRLACQRQLLQLNCDRTGSAQFTCVAFRSCLTVITSLAATSNVEQVYARAALPASCATPVDATNIRESKNEILPSMISFIKRHFFHAKAVTRLPWFRFTI